MREKLEDVRTSHLASVSVAGSSPVFRYVINEANSPSAACSSEHSPSSGSGDTVCTAAATATSIAGLVCKGASKLSSLISWVVSVSGEIRESASATEFCFPGRYSTYLFYLLIVLRLVGFSAELRT